MGLLNKLNDQYLKFYYTENKNLPMLLKDSGAIVVLLEKKTLSDVNNNDNHSNLLFTEYKKSNNTDQLDMYSIWIGGIKIVSGHGLFSSSINDLNNLLQDIYTKLDNTITSEESYDNFVLREPQENNLMDPRSDLSQTYFIDSNKLNEGENTYVQLKDMYDYIERVYNKITYKNYQIKNIIYSIVYTKNKYSLEQHVIDKPVLEDQDNVYFNIPNQSILKQINISYSIRLPQIDDELESTIKSTLSGIQNSVQQDNISKIENDTVYSVNSQYELQANFNAYMLKDKEVTYNININSNIYIDLPPIKFNYYDNSFGYVIKTNLPNHNITSMNAMIDTQGNTLIYDYDLRNEGNNDYFNINKHDRIYILINESYQLNETYIKCFYSDEYYNANEISKLANYTNITDCVYKYTKVFKYNDKFYNAYGFNVNSLFSKMVSTADKQRIHRMFIKITLDVNDNAIDYTNFNEFNANKWLSNVLIDGQFANLENGWANINGIITNNDIDYLESTEFETTNWTQDNFNVNSENGSRIFNYIY